MSKFNEDRPITESIYLGSPSAAKTAPGIHFPKKSRITAVRLLNGANIAAQAGSHTKLELKNGDTVLATMDTTVTEEGAVVANVAKSFDIAEGGVLVDAATNVKVVLSEVEGIQEVTKITCLPATGLDVKSFLIHDDIGSVGVWIDEDGGAAEPAGAAAAARDLELALTGLTTAAEVATALAALLDGDSKFAAIVDPDDDESVLVTVSTVGAKTDATDAAAAEGTGFTFEVITQGVAATAQALTNAQVCVDFYPL